MRFVALALIPITLPIFIALLKAHRDKRDWALFAIGVLLFMVGTLSMEAAVISWRMWQGYSRGMFISLIDTLALALIITRVGPRAATPYLGLMVLYMLPATFSLLFSRVPMASLFVASQVLRVFIMFVAIAGEVRRPSAMRALFAGIAVGLCVQGGYVAWQKVSGVVQARGTTSHQNILGMMVEMALIPLLALVLEGERRKLIYFGIIAGVIVVAGGGSRATMGFTAAGLVLVILLSLIRNKTPRKMKVLGMAALASLVVVPLSYGTLKERFGQSEISFNSSEDQRPLFEKAARSIARDYPFGTGANTYVLIANDEGYAQRAGVSWGGGNLAAPVHNSHLLMRAEMGWAGQLVMLIMLLAPIVGGMRVAFTDRRSPLLGMGVGSAVVATITALHCNYEYAWHIEIVQRIYFMNIAVLAACIMVARNARVEQARKSRPRPAKAEPLPVSARHEPSQI